MPPGEASGNGTVFCGCCDNAQIKRCLIISVSTSSLPNMHGIFLSDSVVIDDYNNLEMVYLDKHRERAIYV